jgi:hypothetical protein
MSEPKLTCRVIADGAKFIAIDSDGHRVGTFETEADARAEIAREERDDAIWERTKELTRYAVVTLMAEFSLELKSVLYWVNSTDGITELGMDGEARP